MYTLAGLCCEVFSASTMTNTWLHDVYVCLHTHTHSLGQSGIPTLLRSPLYILSWCPHWPLDGASVHRAHCACVVSERNRESCTANEHSLIKSLTFLIRIFSINIDWAVCQYPANFSPIYLPPKHERGLCKRASRQATGGGHPGRHLAGIQP